MANHQLISAAEQARSIAENLVSNSLLAAKSAQEANRDRSEYEQEAERQLRRMLRQALTGIRSLVAIAKDKGWQDLIREGGKVNRNFGNITLFEIISLHMKKQEFLGWAWLNYNIVLYPGDVTIEIEQHPKRLEEDLEASYSLLSPCVEIDRYGSTRRISRADMLTDLMSLHQICDPNWSKTGEYEALRFLLDQPVEDFLSAGNRQTTYTYNSRLHWLAFFIRCGSADFLEELTRRALATYTEDLKTYAARQRTV